MSSLAGCLRTHGLSYSSSYLSPFYEPSSDFAAPLPWMALAPALSALLPTLLLMPGDLVLVGFPSTAMCCTGSLTATSLFLASSELLCLM